MTTTEALKGVLDGLEFGEFALAKALADQALDGTQDYTAEQSKGVDLAAVELLFVAYSRPDVSEGGYGLNHPDFLRKIKERLLYLATRHQLQPILAQLAPKSQVKGASPW
jgi:hypothetical protein